MPHPPVVDGLRIYPVKALRGTALATSDVAIWGLDHDRRWMVVQPDGRFLTQREIPAMARISAHASPGALTLAVDTAGRSRSRSRRLRPGGVRFRSGAISFPPSMPGRMPPPG